MNDVHIRTLKETDAEALLTFELSNRAWFERHVDARDAAFYSLQGVTEHIAAYLLDFAMGRWHPFVLESSDGQIVGRANLKSIDRSDGSAEVGYRIAERACGQGLATLAVQHLIQSAKSRWNLRLLVAHVSAANTGSAKVLERSGFISEKSGQPWRSEDSYRFSLSI